VLARKGQRPKVLDVELSEALQMIGSGVFSRGDRDVFAPLVRDLYERDPFCVLADFRAYAEAQTRVAKAYADRDWWTRAAILNVARAGYFSSDRSILEYAKKIWNVPV
jgi:starch phosphorylase